MTDARRFNTIYSVVHSMTPAQDLMVLGGVISFCAGIAVSSALAKIALLLCAGGLFAYVTVRVARRIAFFSQTDTGGLPIASEEGENQMKKLVFDDFQSSGRQYKIETVEEPGSTYDAQRGTAGTMPENEKSSTLVFELNEFIESPTGGEKPDSGQRVEFNTLIKRILTVVKDVNFAYTAALFWINREKQQLVLENFDSDSEKFMSHRRLSIGSDLVSQVAVKGKPQIVNYVNALSQSDILPYYEAPEAVKTFVGIPIFFSGPSLPAPQDAVAVLVLDCREADAYGGETMTSLAQVAKLISTLIRSYTAKYDLLLDSEVLRSIARMREQLSIDFGAHSITRSLADEVSKLLPWDYITVVLFDDSRKSWMIHYLLNRMNDAYVPLLSEIDAQHSLVAGVIQSSIPQVLGTLENNATPRFYQAERCESKGSLMIIPLNSLSRCYGALVVESKDQQTYSDADVKLIQNLTETSSWALEILNLTEVMNNFVSLDETTGLLTRKHFVERLQEEVQRANDFSTDLALAMISIDRMDDQIGRHGREAFDFVLQNISRMVKASIRAYDIVGRYDFNCFIVLLVNTTSNEASLWAEKIRKNVASNIINIDARSFSVTISIGVAGAIEEVSDIELLENTSRVLHKAVEAGGNVVRVY
jgi:diguanylate cyclase (GGDEF)-like protein